VDPTQTEGVSVIASIGLILVVLNYVLVGLAASGQVGRFDNSTVDIHPGRLQTEKDQALNQLPFPCDAEKEKENDERPKMLPLRTLLHRDLTTLSTFWKNGRA
jgi:hypothetical protein